MTGFILLLAAPAFADERPKLQDVPREIERGRMERRDERTSRFDVEMEALAPAGMNETTATVRLKNLSDFAVEEVELTCTAFDEGENELATTPWRLTESGGDAMEPGETATIHVRFAASSNKVRSATCNAIGW